MAVNWLLTVSMARRPHIVAACRYDAAQPWEALTLLGLSPETYMALTRSGL